ncbi:hypothetical protein PPACK8108_LOCUS15688 [Phakopsora pachyrhizi]|uniref:Peptidase A1 domain-containing protein n=1 Tax=Phakopsora pachyrhizi TaxID=170000 RepID=A0AAV0B852_PHAPC|nr:hypothetical protein PPACK8108_LOCUS15688 [Phakopsora pachyrhizi]
MAVSSYQLLMDIDNQYSQLSNRASRDAPSKISPVDISSNSNDANCGWVEGVRVVFDVDPEPKSYLSGLQQRTQVPETAQSECSFQTPRKDQINKSSRPNQLRPRRAVQPIKNVSGSQSTSMLSTFLKSILEPHPIVQGHSGYRCKWCSRIITEELICCQTANTSQFCVTATVIQPLGFIHQLLFYCLLSSQKTNRYLPFTLGTTSSTSADTEGGEAVFGGLDKAHYEGKIYYAPVCRCGYWEVELKSVKFGDKEIKLHNVGAAINTGQ